MLGEAAKKAFLNPYVIVIRICHGGIRDKLIHEYFGVNLQVVWQTVQEDLPLAKILARMVTDLQREDHR